MLLALSYKARLLILDEPTAGLDVVARETILDLLRSYMEQEGRGILISSHISSDLEGLCDDLYLIDDGKIALHEEMDVLLDQYGLLKMDEATWQSIDKSWILRWKKEPWGVSARQVSEGSIRKIIRRWSRRKALWMRWSIWR